MTKHCEQCNTDTTNPRFCCHACSIEYARAKREKRYLSRKCVECKGSIPTSKEAEQKFCSRSCAATFNNRKYIKRERKKTRGTGSCLFCNKVLTNRRSICCNQTCASRYRVAKKVEAWKQDPLLGTDKYGLRDFVRKYLIEQAGYKCSRCGWGEVNPASGNVPLQIDHVDGDCHNNEASNLEVLCPNCHSLTPTYGNLNKGNSKRSYRLNKTMLNP